MESRFFTKKDVINITPFLDIMLDIFVIIIVVASFKEDINKNKEKELLQRISLLEKRLSDLKRENTNLIEKNNFLEKQILQKEMFVNKSREILSKCVLKVSVMDNYLKIGNSKYTAEQFLNLAKNGFIKNADFYIKKTDTAKNFYEELKKKLERIGFIFKD